MFHQITNSIGNHNYNKTIYQNIKWEYHFHKNFELIYVISGKVKMTSGDMTDILEEGQFAFVLSNKIHSYDSPKASVSCVIVFSEDFVPDFASFVKNKESGCLSFECTDSIKEYFIENIVNDDPDIFIKKSCLYAVCSQYIQKVPIYESRQSDIISEIIDYVTEKFRQNISLKQAADVLGYEYHYLSRVFHSKFHMNFRQFINLYRFDYASQIMLNTSAPVSQIAMESGFQCIRSFNDIFRQLSGMSPTEFRTHYRKL